MPRYYRSRGFAIALGQQTGDPAKLASALITIVDGPNLPRRFLAGADAVATAEQVADQLQKETSVYRELSSSLAYGESAS